MHVVFDNSTLISAAIRPDSIPDQALNAGFLNHRVFTSDEVMDELKRVIIQAKFDRYVPPASRALFLAKFSRDALCVAVFEADLSQVRGACRDRNDEQLLALCLAAGADVLVSSDQDLLVLPPWRDIPIVTPARFLSLFGEGGNE